MNPEDLVQTLTAERIHREILPKLKDGASFMDALIEYAAERDLDIEEVGSVVRRSSILKELIEEEASRLNLLNVPKKSAVVF